MQPATPAPFSDLTSPRVAGYLRAQRVTAPTLHDRRPTARQTNCVPIVSRIAEP